MMRKLFINRLNLTTKLFAFEIKFNARHPLKLSVNNRGAKAPHNYDNFCSVQLIVPAARSLRLGKQITIESRLFAEYRINRKSNKLATGSEIIFTKTKPH